MTDKDPRSGARQTSVTFPSITTPTEVAEFGLGLGYDRDNVVRAVVKQCDLDEVTAGRIVDDAANTQPGGHA